MPATWPGSECGKGGRPRSRGPCSQVGNHVEPRRPHLSRGPCAELCLGEMMSPLSHCFQHPPTTSRAAQEPRVQCTLECTAKGGGQTPSSSALDTFRSPWPFKNKAGQRRGEVTARHMGAPQMLRRDVLCPGCREVPAAWDVGVPAQWGDACTFPTRPPGLTTPRAEVSFRFRSPFPTQQALASRRSLCLGHSPCGG